MHKEKWNGDISKGVRLSSDKLTVMAGPCMLESLELGLKVGEFLKGVCAREGVQYVFKSSYDKANRTSKNSIRGPGLDQGLNWLSIIQQKLDVPVLTDIHTPEQAEQAGKVVDILQIPAFLCKHSQLLSAAAKTGKTLQIKKGQHTSFEEMLLIAEFLENQGNNKVILCERGTSFGYNNLVVDYRNMFEMQRAGYKVVFDATHSAQLPGAGNGVSSGLRHVVPALARAALGMGIQGLFIEVHQDPDNALSDAATQLTLPLAESVIQQCRTLFEACQSLSPTAN